MVAQSAKNLLELWETSSTSHPYMFYKGTDFRKLKVPTLWYDIASVCDALSQVEGIKKDERFQEILDILLLKQKQDGMFTPESIYMKLAEWGFGQKKTPSPYLTYLNARIFLKIENKS